MVKDSDGTVRIEPKDGSETLLFPGDEFEFEGSDGSQTTVSTNNNSVNIKNTDGSEVEIRGDGTVTTDDGKYDHLIYFPDGRETREVPGPEWYTYYPNDITFIQQLRGISKFIFPGNSSSLTEYPDGRTLTEKAPNQNGQDNVTSPILTTWNSAGDQRLWVLDSSTGTYYNFDNLSAEFFERFFCPTPGSSNTAAGPEGNTPYTLNYLGDGQFNGTIGDTPFNLNGPIRDGSNESESCSVILNANNQRLGANQADLIAAYAYLDGLSLWMTYPQPQSLASLPWGLLGTLPDGNSLDVQGLFSPWGDSLTISRQGDQITANYGDMQKSFTLTEAQWRSGAPAADFQAKPWRLDNRIINISIFAGPPLRIVLRPGDGQAEAAQQIGMGLAQRAGADELNVRAFVAVEVVIAASAVVVRVASNDVSPPRIPDDRDRFSAEAFTANNAYRFADDPVPHARRELEDAKGDAYSQGPRYDPQAILFAGTSLSTAARALSAAESVIRSMEFLSNPDRYPGAVDILEQLSGHGSVNEIDQECYEDALEQLQDSRKLFGEARYYLFDAYRKDPLAGSIASAAQEISSQLFP